MIQDLQVLLVEDDWTVRSALVDYLAKKQISVVATDAYEPALAAARTQQFDVAIVDIVLPRTSGERAAFRDNIGLDVARDLRRVQPAVGIIFLSAYVDRGPEVIQLYMEGHENIVYLAKGSKPAELMDALHNVTHRVSTLEIGAGITRARESHFDVVWKMMSPPEQELAQRALDRMGNLSEAEQQVFQYLSMCLNRREVAVQLHVTAKTVDYHINNLYGKLLLNELPEGFNASALLIKIAVLSQLKRELPASRGRP
jgi:two-component system, NarL family, response regulator LiaR